jgi:hypothetical protein
MLNPSFGQDGRGVVGDAGWEWPVAVEHGSGGVRVWGRSYDLLGGSTSHGWRFNATGDAVFTVDLEAGLEVVDAVSGGGDGSVASDGWSWTLSERAWLALDTAGVAGLMSAVVVDAWDVDDAVYSVEFSFIGPVQTPTSIAHSGGWLAVAGHGLDSCCAHTERPVLAVLNAATGSYRPGFGAAGRVALDMAAWALEDSVRHEASGVFYDVQFQVLPSGDTAVVACGGYQAQSYFQPMAARLGLSGPFAGALDTTFGQGGIMTVDLDPLHNLMAMACAPRSDGGLDLLLRADGGGDMPEALHQLSLDVQGNPTALLEFGSPPPVPLDDLEDSPVLAVDLVQLDDGALWALGTAGDDLAFDGHRRPVAHPFLDPAPWWQDTTFDSHAFGAALSEGDTLWVASQLHDGPAQWAADQSALLLTPWVRTATEAVDNAFSALTQGPYPVPTTGPLHWQLPPGTVQLYDMAGRRWASWTHPGGLFRVDLTAELGASGPHSAALGLVYIGEQIVVSRRVILRR